jgi:hypothetical protein
MEVAELHESQSSLSLSLMSSPYIDWAPLLPKGISLSSRPEGCLYSTYGDIASYGVQQQLLCKVTLRL